MFTCAECGTTDATSYVVTTLDPDDVAGTRTEVCLDCHEEITTPGGDTTVEEADAYLRSLGIDPDALRYDQVLGRPQTDR